MDPRYLSITWLAPGVEKKNKLIFVVADRSIFTGFTIPISYFQVFFIFFIRSFFYIFRFCLAFVFSEFSWPTYFAKSKILYSWGTFEHYSQNELFFFQKICQCFAFRSLQLHVEFQKKILRGILEKIYLSPEILTYWPTDTLTEVIS